MARILIISNDLQTQEIINVDLKRRGYVLDNADSIDSGIDSIVKLAPDIVICDYEFNERNGIEVFQFIKQNTPNTEFILMTQRKDISVIDIASDLGVFDYILKPVNIDKLNLKILRAIKIKEISSQLKSLKTDIKQQFLIENNLAFSSPLMKKVSENITKLSNNYASVYIQGPSGVGKELIAKILHYSGVTRSEPFIKVNCTEFSGNEILQELFGSQNNVSNEVGKLELAGSGTIYLDECSQLDANVQKLLLEVITQREFKVRNGEIIKLNARVIFSSAYDTDELVRISGFNNELAEKLNIFKINIPPLRHRKEDIPLIVTQILKKINKDIHKNVFKVPIEVIEFLQSYDWPGNVRELENVLYRGVLRSKNSKLEIEDINWSISQTDGNNGKILSLEEVERLHILEVLNKVNWDKAKAIEILGISKPTLYAKLKKYKMYN